MRELSTIQQTYIETIHQLCETDSPARTKAIAAAVGVRMASVTEVVQSLATSGLVDYRKRFGATLTSEGLEIAEELKKRHAVLAEFFRRIGCEERMADEAACAVEHSINSEIAELLVQHLSDSNTPTRRVENIGDVAYLDNAAALSPSPRLLGTFSNLALAHPGNPESAHALGESSAETLNRTAKNLLAALGIEEYSVFWTASATDAINLAARSAFPRTSRKHPVIATTAAEHAALANSLRAMDADIRIIPLRRDGAVDFDFLDKILDSKVDLVALHHVQNETGAIQDLTAIRERMDILSPAAALLVDTVQSIGKIPVPWRSASIDIAFVGGHKLGAPSGGALIVKTADSPFGSAFATRVSRERSEFHSIGRPDIPVALTLAEAVIDTEALRNTRLTATERLNKRLRNVFAAKFAEKGFAPLLPPHAASPYITTFLLPPFQGEIVARALSGKGVMVSAKSACAAAKTAPSAALMAMGLSEKDARTAIRVSFGFDTSENDIDRFVDALDDVVREY